MHNLPVIANGIQRSKPHHVGQRELGTLSTQLYDQDNMLRKQFERETDHNEMEFSALQEK